MTASETVVKAVVDRVCLVGAGAIDFIAFLPTLPKLDSKVRSRDLKVSPGGNCLNVSVGLARLSTSQAVLVSLLGKDGNAETVLRGIKEEGVETSLIISKTHLTTAMTYIIADEETNSRTCIHSPVEEEIAVSEIQGISSYITTSRLLHLDTRHTLAAVEAARIANTSGVLVSCDVEKHRPNLEALLPLVDLFFTNNKFPGMYRESPVLVHSMSALLGLPRAQVVITTLGSLGSVLMRQKRENRKRPAEMTSPQVEEEEVAIEGRVFQVLRCKAVSVPKEKIVDTTGAGDSFVAGVLSSLLNERESSKALCSEWLADLATERLKAALINGSEVAAIKIQGSGIDALPYRNTIKWQ